MKLGRSTSILLGLCLLLGLASPAYAIDKRLIDVVSVSWAGAPAALVSVNDIENSIKNEVGSRWKRYTSFEGSLEDKSITFEHGLTLSSPIVLNAPMQCEGSKYNDFMYFVREEAYSRLAVSDSASRYLVILTPEAGCIWSGRAFVGDIKKGGGLIALQNSASPFIIVHELGHSLGLGHSNFLKCDSGKKDGPWGNDCKALEYGGTVDVMGNVDVDAPLSIYHQWILGYLENSQVHQSWLNEKVELNANDLASGTKAIFIRDGNAAYWLEYRRASFATNYRPGLVLYRTDPPPSSVIVSPNPLDSIAVDAALGITTDYWMLNWDDYNYSRSRASGSMTLPQGSIATTFSGNISITATPTDSDRKVLVSITRKADTKAPPTPELIDSALWKYPNIPILKPGFEDEESAIASFEVELNGKIVEVDSSSSADFAPTYLNPLSAPKTLLLKNLPEGNYKIAVRSIDVWGNKSAWSKSIEAYVDRSNPKVESKFKLISITSKESQVSWSGARDEGIGLCSTILHTPEGFILARSSAKIAPTFTISTGKSLSAQSQVFDCLGNGIAGQISLTTSLIEPSKSKRTGKWSAAPVAYGPNALKCIGKCSASLSLSGNAAVLIGEGSAEVMLSSKPILMMPASQNQVMRISNTFEIGARNKLIRISGSNFIFGGVAKLEATSSGSKEISRGAEVSDPSLLDAEQRAMARLGFNSQDFTSEWTVLPMARGTTLLDPTLDLCGGSYKSEAGRELRRQIAVTRPESPYLFLSSESVRYKTAAGAAAALSELKSYYKQCLTNKGGSENGIFTDYTFQTFPTPNSNLVNEDSRVIVRATIGKGASVRQLLGLYQYSGQFFTGLYVVKPGADPIPNDEILRWFDVAGILAQRLVELAGV